MTKSVKSYAPPPLLEVEGAHDEVIIRQTLKATLPATLAKCIKSLCEKRSLQEFPPIPKDP
jgi:hypothetical protein